jgi:hypothetical protein
MTEFCLKVNTRNFYHPILIIKIECRNDFDLIIIGYSVSSCSSSLTEDVKLSFPDNPSFILINYNKVQKYQLIFKIFNIMYRHLF